MLVKGGTHPVGMGQGVRILEFGSDLEPVDSLLAAKVTEDFNKASTIKDIEELLGFLIDNDYNIVGTRDYVYSSRKMLTEFHKLAYMVEAFKEIGVDPLSSARGFLLLTRSLGLRNAAARVLLGITIA